MRLRFVAVLLGMLTVAIPSLPSPAQALSCVHPKDQLNDLALIVEGKVENLRSASEVAPALKPWLADIRRQAATLEVSRYFKGAGPATIDFLYTSMGYAQVPTVGTTVVIGLHYNAEFGRYTASDCSLMALPTRMHEWDKELIDLVHHYYGDGRPPEAAVPGRESPIPLEGHGLLWTGMGALALLVVTVHARRARSACLEGV